MMLYKDFFKVLILGEFKYVAYAKNTIAACAGEHVCVFDFSKNVLSCLFKVSSNANFVSVSCDGELITWIRKQNDEYPFFQRQNSNTCQRWKKDKTCVWDSRRLSSCPIWSDSPKDSQIVATCSRRFLNIWDMNLNKKLKKLKTNYPVKRIAFSTDGALVAVALWDPSSSIHIWNVKTGKREKKLLTRQYNSVSCLAFSTNGKKIAFGGGQDCVSIFDVQTNAPDTRFWERGVDPIAFWPGDSEIIYGAIGCVHREIILRNIHSGVRLRRFSMPSRIISFHFRSVGAYRSVVVGTSLGIYMGQLFGNYGRILSLLACQLPPYVILDILNYELSINGDHPYSMEDKFDHVAKIKTIALLQNLLQKVHKDKEQK